MRYLVGFVFLLLGLGTLRTVGCGDESPCGDCSDGNPCTIDQCSSRRVGEPPGMCEPDERPVEPYCSHRVAPDGTSCGGGNVCVNRVCSENLCAGCVNDGNQCTEYCDYETGACNQLRWAGSCVTESGRDGLCSREGVCIVCEELDCDDGDLCTHDRCSDSSGCVNEPMVCWDGEDRCAECDPETGECIDALAEGNHCHANRELGIDGEYLSGFCESGRCTGQPCDVTSDEVYPCPLDWRPSPGEPMFCCLWSSEQHPRGYCLGHANCMDARCLEVCPEHYAECWTQNGVCPGE